MVDGDGGRTTVRGQVAVATSTGHVHHVAVIPKNPPAQAEALVAVEEADWVILGPGSWYTSVIPHLLVPELREVLRTTKAKRALTLNLNAEKETQGMSAADHIRTVCFHAPGLKLDVILADPSSIDDIDETERAAVECGAQLMLRQVRMSDGSARHDPLRLAAAYRDAFEGVFGDVFDAD